MPDVYDFDSFCFFEFLYELSQWLLTRVGTLISKWYQWSFSINIIVLLFTKLY